jgi:thymidylate synthase
MKQYLDDLRFIRDNGEHRIDRTGVGTYSVFGMQTRYNLRKYFPAPHTKTLAFKAVVSELLWFLEGSTDERRLCEIMRGTRDPSKRTIWTDNADKQGVALGYRNDDQVKELGPIYGKQWRKWGPRLGDHIDQLAELIEGIKKDPMGRRHILTAWNPGEIKQMALPPCHILAQFYVSMNGELSCQLYQRSADFFLGVPFNIASYALLTHMIAQVTGLQVGDFVHTIGDAHIYANHLDQVNEQLSREPGPLPVLRMNPNIYDIDGFHILDFSLEGYDPHPPIPAPMAV